MFAAKLRWLGAGTAAPARYYGHRPSARTDPPEHQLPPHLRPDLPPAHRCCERDAPLCGHLGLAGRRRRTLAQQTGLAVDLRTDVCTGLEGAGEGTRTPNLQITSQVRYQLRHAGRDAAPTLDHPPRRLRRTALSGGGRHVRRRRLGWRRQLTISAPPVMRRCHVTVITAITRARDRLGVEPVKLLFERTAVAITGCDRSARQ